MACNMSNQSASSTELDRYRAALTKARDTIAELVQENQNLRTPARIAVTGMSCRFPAGANTPADYWDLLKSGRDGISTIDDRRWPTSSLLSDDPDAKGKMYTCQAGLIDQPADQFDATMFSMSPKECAALDPQQRLLLETSWEALEDAGIIPSSINQSATAFYVGMSGDDYACMHRHSGVPELIDAYSLTGTTMSTAAGRLSYFYGAQGPSLTLDTACSSSLVAIHLAVRSLRAGECDMALVGASNLILTPENHIAFCRLRALSPKGRCKTFSADADGYVRSEGAAFIVLERSTDATKKNRRVHGFIDGSAINQDGRTAGLSAPNSQAQTAVIRAALRDAGLTSSDIDYVEAHGTGTELGDPIEIEGLLGAHRDDRENPLLIGSAKSNIGHMEPCAGLGGLIKILLALKHKEIPANLHFSKPNPLIPWNPKKLRVVAEHTPWQPQAERVRRAGLSSFGFSGTNAHVIVSEPAFATDPERSPDASLFTLTCSAQTVGSLRKLAVNYCALLRSQPDSLYDICASSNLRRSSFRYRKYFVGRTAEEIILALENFSGSTAHVNLQSLNIGGSSDTVWMFTGQGSQYLGMAGDLYAQDRIIREVIDCVSDTLAPLREGSIRDLLLGNGPDSDSSLIHRTEYSQPALFALQYALAQRWLAWGFRPGAVVGHSIGEYAAACVAGVFTFEDAIHLVEARSRLMGALPSGGGMCAARMSEDELNAALREHGRTELINVAAVNGASETVFSGPADAIRDFSAALLRQGVRINPLEVSHAFHSHMMRSIASDFRDTFPGVEMRAPSIVMPLNIIGHPDPQRVSSAEYWTDQIQSTVRFNDCITYLEKQGFDRFLELGPQPILKGIVRARPSGSRAVASLKKGESAWRAVISAHIDLLEIGVTPDWNARYPDSRHVDLPLYPFERERFWIDQKSDRPDRIPRASDTRGENCFTLNWDPLSLSSHESGNWLCIGATPHPVSEASATDLSRRIWAGFSVEQARRAIKTQTFDGVLIVTSAKPEYPEGIDEILTSVSFTRELIGMILADSEIRRVWIVGDSDRNDLSLAAHRGLLQSLLLEHPDLKGGVIEGCAYDHALVQKILDDPAATGWLRVKSDKVQHPRIVPIVPAQDSFRPDHVIISGGFGGIGISLAKEMAKRGCRSMSLFGRNRPRPQAAAQLQELRELGVSLELLEIDLGESASVPRLEAMAKAHPKSTFFHCAGVLSPDDEESLDLTFSGKVLGALHIMKSLSHFPEIRLVLMGSVAAIIGTPGFSAYGAANSALSEIAMQRQAAGGDALCVHWGPWADGGIMSAEKQRQTQATGFSPLSTTAAVRALGGLPRGVVDPIVATVDWSRVADAIAVTRSLDILKSFESRTADKAVDLSTPAMRAITTMAESDQSAALLSQLSRLLGAILGRDSGEPVHADRGFFDQGMDSIKALEFREAIGETLGIHLEASDIFDYPTPKALCNYILVGIENVNEPRSIDDEPMEIQPDIAALSDSDLAKLIDAEYESSQANRA